MNAETRDVWTRPIQATVAVPMDQFKVQADDGFPGVHIRLEGHHVYVSVEALDHISYLKSKTMEYTEFVSALGRVFFGDDWSKSR